MSVSPAPVQTDTSLRGIVFALVGVSVFPFHDVIVKLLSGRYPVLEIMFVRSVVALPLNLALVWWLEGGPHALRLRRPWLMTARSALIITAFTSFYMAIATLALAELAALYFVAPLLMTAIAALVLRESVGAHRWSAVAVGFAGVLVMLRPGAGVFEPAALLGLLAALAYACAQLITRNLGRTESGASIAFYTTAGYLLVAGFAGLVSGTESLPADTHPSLAFLLRPWQVPNVHDAALMAICAPIATVGIFCLIQAYRLAPAPLVAPFEYLMLLWAVSNRWLFWGDLPDTYTWIGMALVAGAGLYVLRRETLRARAERATRARS